MYSWSSVEHVWLKVTELLEGGTLLSSFTCGTQLPLAFRQFAMRLHLSTRRRSNVSLVHVWDIGLDTEWEAWQSLWKSGDRHIREDVIWYPWWKDWKKRRMSSNRRVVDVGAVLEHFYIISASVLAIQIRNSAFPSSQGLAFCVSSWVLLRYSWAKTYALRTP